MIDLLARRREMMGASGGSAPKFATGTWTQTGSMSVVHQVTHNLGTTNVIAMWRNTNVRWDVTGAMGGWVITNISQYNYDGRANFAFASEARSNGTQYNNVYPNIVSAPTTDSLYLYARNDSYGFIVGDTYEWIVVSLANPDAEQSVTLTSTQATYEYSHNLDSLNVLGAMTKDTASFGVNVVNASYYAPKFFKDFTGIVGIEIESRTSYATSSIALGLPSTTYSANSLTFKGRTNAYPFIAGDYTIKCVKYS